MYRNQVSLAFDSQDRNFLKKAVWKPLNDFLLEN